MLLMIGGFLKNRVSGNPYSKYAKLAKNLKDYSIKNGNKSISICIKTLWVIAKLRDEDLFTIRWVTLGNALLFWSFDFFCKKRLRIPSPVPLSQVIKVIKITQDK